MTKPTPEQTLAAIIVCAYLGGYRDFATEYDLQIVEHINFDCLKTAFANYRRAKARQNKRQTTK